jgi:K+-transporting ATPase ATPase A chain
MSGAGLFQLLLLALLLAVTAPPLGRYLAAVYATPGERTKPPPGERFFAPIERRLYRLVRVDQGREQRWNVYAISLLAFSVVSLLACTRCNACRSTCR